MTDTGLLLINKGFFVFLNGACGRRKAAGKAGRANGMQVSAHRPILQKGRPIRQFQAFGAPLFSYSFSKWSKFSSLKNRLAIMATTVASPIPLNEAVPILIVAPLKPTARTRQVRIKFCDFP